ncbi:hypothetical protein EV421DRAFT_1845898 [Armillaria borealis]|uniref:Uncharacterized protein n=1 Tax=Armillaria borealis TaxID=47425 RepID=A0AA39MFU4_9AGAR|nr:hypothetical protein EV421DRAFT_1845898 [Armillaria borealis]
MAELTDSEIKAIFVALDTEFNVVMLNALTHGIHTGVVAVTLWTVASRKKDGNYRRPRFFCGIIILLYLLAAFNFYCQWVVEASYFGVTGKSFAEAYQSYRTGIAIPLAQGIDAILSTVLADATLIWRCWIVWSRSWLIVLVPIACTLLATASRGIATYYTAFGAVENTPPQAFYLENVVNWAVLYSSLILVTLLWCTILIIYRIVRVGGAAGRTRVYQRLIEMLVESALLYSAAIVVLLVLQVRNDVAGTFVEVVAIAIRAIAPTILVGRVAAGHARPDDSWGASTPRSSLRFRNNSSSQNDSQVGAGSQWGTSSRARPDVEEGLEGSTQR